MIPFFFCTFKKREKTNAEIIISPWGIVQKNDHAIQPRTSPSNHFHQT